MKRTMLATAMAGLALLAIGSVAHAGDKADAKGKKGDGSLAQQMIEKFDKNGDGKLDANELAAALQWHQEQHAKTEKVVKSGKGANELGAGSNTHRAEELIKKYDNNGDHKLDATELQTALSALQAEHAEHKKPGTSN